MKAVATLTLLLALPGPVLAQHEGHSMPPAAAPKPAAQPAVKAAPKHALPAKKTTTAPAAARTKPAPAKHVASPAHTTPHAGHDMGTMDHSQHAMPASGSDAHAGHDMGAMDHSQHAMSTSGSDPHAGHDMGAMHAAPADAPRTPIPALTDADRAAAFPPVSGGHAAHDEAPHSFVLLDRLEVGDDGGGAWEARAWYGGDIDRAWLRSGGHVDGGGIEDASVELFYGHLVSPWWDVVAGLRHDFGEGPSRTWAAVGVQGLAPYKFEVEATAYVGDGGRTAARLEAEYDTLLTNRLILQWRGEADLYGRDDPARGIGRGLSTVEAGARLRYEVTRRLAPYVGVEVERAFGRTAGLRRDEGERTRDTRAVAGLRLWF